MKRWTTVTIPIATISMIVLVVVVGLAVNNGSSPAAAVESTVVPTGAMAPANEQTHYDYIEEPAEIYFNPGEPAIVIPKGVDRLTIDIVKAYLDVNPHPYVKYGTTAAVVGFECLTIGDINSLLRSNIPVAKATPACLVSFVGEFVFDTGDEEDILGDRGYQVFDPVTGNLYSTQFKNSEINHIP